MARCVISVPGSTSNFAHGFDSMGAAVSLRNRIVVTTGNSDGLSGTDDLVAFATPVHAACCERWGSLPGIHIEVEGEVPRSRGLGSSATVYLGLCAALQQLAGRELDRGELIRLALGWEGHPDNLVAAALGGFTIAGPVNGDLHWQRFALPERLAAVVAIPDHSQLTSEARGVLPQQLPRDEAIRAWQRAAMIAAAFASEDHAGLRGLFDDAWHERHRAGMNPGLLAAREAAVAAGAYGAFLSGSGSTVLALVDAAHQDSVASALEASYATAGIPCAVQACAFDNDGLIVSESP